MNGINKEAVKKLLSIIKIAYPNSKIDLNNEMHLELWHDNLKDLEAGKLAIAVKATIATSEYPPNIATIRKKYAEIDSPIKVDNEEGWGLVMKAVRYYGYTRPNEAMNSLPVQVQRAVQYVGGFQTICESENLGVVRGQFAKAMESVNERIKNNVAVGIGITEQIHRFNQLAEDNQKLKLEVQNIEEYTKSTADENAHGIESVREILSKCINQ